MYLEFPTLKKTVCLSKHVDLIGSVGSQEMIYISVGLWVSRVLSTVKAGKAVAVKIETAPLKGNYSH